MKITVLIGGVDGESNFQAEVPRAKYALDFLEKYDHEGSSVTVTIELNAEEGYKLLELIAADERRDERR